MIFREENHKSFLKKTFSRRLEKFEVKVIVRTSFVTVLTLIVSTKLFSARYKFILYLDISEKSHILPMEERYNEMHYSFTCTEY